MFDSSLGLTPRSRLSAVVSWLVVVVMPCSKKASKSPSFVELRYAPRTMVKPALRLKKSGQNLHVDAAEVKLGVVATASTLRRLGSLESSRGADGP